METHSVVNVLRSYRGGRSMKKVLIIDHNVYLQNMWVRQLGGRAAVYAAHSIEAAEKEFSKNKDFAVIVVNACMPDAKDGAHEHEINTVPLVVRIRAEFKGQMVAISGFPSFREKLVEAGCDCSCNKELLVILLSRILDLD